jgi:hypothetical protein
MCIDDTSVVSFNKDTAKTKFEEFDSTQGKIEKFNTLGFGQMKLKGYRIFIFAGILKRTKQNSQFSIGILPEKKTKYLAGIHFRIY